MKPPKKRYRGFCACGNPAVIKLAGGNFVCPRCHAIEKDLETFHKINAGVPEPKYKAMGVRLDML